jgi:hypothetical protein
MKLIKIINRARREFFNLTHEQKEPTFPPSAAEEMEIKKLREAINRLPIIAPDTSSSEAEKSWRQNCLELRDMINNYDPRNFLNWKIIQGTMFFGANSANYLEFKELKKDWNYWRNMLKESPVGNPRPYYLKKNSSGNLIHYAYSLEQLRKLSVDLKNFEQVVEVGGGYGGMARLIFSLGFAGNCIIFDLPEFSALQSYYLNSVDKKIAEKTAFVSDAENIKNHFSPGKKTLFIATWSLSEMPIKTRNEIFSSVGKIDAYLIAYQKNFGEVDNEKYFSSFVPEDKIKLKKQYKINHLVNDYYLLILSQ